MKAATPAQQNNHQSVITGDCREVLRELPEESAHCVVTSPPYFHQRDYGAKGQIGLEQTPDTYVAELVAVFREVRRVLRNDGTLWLVLGDTYASTNLGNGIKAKELIGVPWMVAFALRQDGWLLRQEIIYSKKNCLPESVTDRCTRSHETVFMLAKGRDYFYDADAIREPHSPISLKRVKAPWKGYAARDLRSHDPTAPAGTCHPLGKNKWTVWPVSPGSYKGAHTATFPPDLIKPMVLAGTSARGCCSRCGAPWGRQGSGVRGRRANRMGDTLTTTTGWEPSCSCNAEVVPCTVLDPFGGAGTTGLVAKALGRDAVLIELNPEYAELARRRITEGSEGRFKPPPDLEKLLFRDEDECLQAAE